MSKVNHERPELKYRDNYLREISRVAELSINQTDTAYAPEIFKPFASNPEAMIGLEKVMLAFNDYLDQSPATVSFIPPPEAISLREACREFGRVRLKNQYDRLYTVHDFLKSEVANPSPTNPFYEWLFQCIEAS